MNRLILLFVLLVPALVLGQGSGFDVRLATYQIHDARSIAMGYTWNTQSDNYYPEFETQWRFIVKDRLHLFGSINDESQENFYKETFDADLTENFTLHKKFPEFTVRTPYRELNENIKIAGGLKYGTPIDFGYNTSQEIDFPDGKSETDGWWMCGLTTIAPSVAVSYNDQVSLSLHYYVPVSFSVMSEFETKDSGGTSKNESEWAFSGGSFFMADLFARFDRLTLSASYQSAFEPEGDSFKTKSFLDGQLISEFENEGWDLKYPSMLQFGAQYDVTDRISVAGDVQFRNYEDFKINDVEAFGDLKNGMKIGLGIENHITDDWTLQFGAALDKVPVPDVDKDDPNDLIKIGGGLETDLNRWLNLALFESIRFNGFLSYSTWCAKTGDDTDYSENLWVLGSNIQMTF